MASSETSSGHNSAAAATEAALKKKVDVAAADVTNCTKNKNNGSPNNSANTGSTKTGNTTSCVAPESNNTTTAVPVQKLQENLYTTPSKDSISNSSPAGAMDTTPMAKKRLEMLEMYKNALGKREEARLELEQLENEAFVSGVPLLEDYAKNPLVLSLPQEGSPRPPSSMTHTVPAFNNESIESERFFIVPQQDQHAYGGFPMHDQHHSPSFVMMNNQMIHANHFNRQQQLEQQLLYQQHQPSDLILQNNNIAGGMATMVAMAPGAAHINDPFRQQSRLASNFGAGAMSSAVPQFLPNSSSGMAMGAAPIDSSIGKRNDYTGERNDHTMGESNDYTN
jgi:hypothetical protein